MADTLPSPGGFLTSELKECFDDVLKQLTADTGRTLKLEFPPTVIECPNCFSSIDGSSNGIYNSTNPNTIGGALHKPFQNGRTCPVCLGSHQIPTENSKSITVRRTWNPEDFDPTPYGIVSQNVVKTTALIDFKSDMKRAKRAFLEGNTLIRILDPVPEGFPSSKWVTVFWRKED